MTQTQGNITHKKTKRCPFPACQHKAAKNRPDSIIKTNWNIYNKKDPHSKKRLGTVSRKNNWRARTCLTAPTSSWILMWIKTHRCLVRMKDPLIIDTSSPSKYKLGVKRRLNRYNPRLKQRWAWLETWHQATNFSFTDKFNKAGGGGGSAVAQW